MLRNIPKQTRVKNAIWKCYSLKDIAVAGVEMAIVIGLVLSNFKGKWIITLITAGIFVGLLLPLDKNTIMYEVVVQVVKFLFSKKKFNTKKHIDKLIPYTELTDDGIIVYPGYYGSVIEVGCKEFGLQTEDEQDLDVERIANLLMGIDVGKALDLVKIDRPILFDDYIADLQMNANNIDIFNGNQKQKMLCKAVLISRKNQLEYFNTEEKVYRSFYYIVVYDSVKSELERVTFQTMDCLESAGLSARMLQNATDTAVFLKYCNTRDFDEREAQGKTPEELLEWIKPNNIQFKGNNYIIDGVQAFSYAIDDYPLNVANAYGAELFDIDKTKVVMHLTPVEQDKAIKRVDKVCQELMAREELNKASEILEQETHLESMSELLQSLQNARENMFDVATVITGFIYDNQEQVQTIRKSIRSRLRMQGFSINNLYARQQEAFITANISKRSAIRSLERGINGSSIAAVFPFVHTAILEKGGVLYGHNSYPVIFDLWKRDMLHQNSNAMIFGRPGSGKSYFLKSFLVNSLADGCFCFIIDPEFEYGDMVKNFDGTMIDVGTATTGRLNPFHIWQILTENGEPATPDVVFYAHLKTLESFFRLVLEGCGHDTLELINNLVVDMYAQKGITESTDVRDYTPEQFPIFDDLYNVLSEVKGKTKNKNARQQYETAENYIKKFAKGGRYSDLWNKPSTLTTDNILTVFNFQSLFANKNNIVANAQMLLVFRFLEQQVINIREHNRTAETPQKVVIVADEAHLFIDAKYPIALDFFYQMVKRIRKYNGTFIPATQNVADWNATESLRSKTSAVIKNAQYTFVFGLNPKDVEDLVELYQSNPINKTEQRLITSATRGQCFFIGATKERSHIQIVTNELVEAAFSNRAFWVEYMQDFKFDEIEQQEVI